MNLGLPEKGNRMLSSFRLLPIVVIVSQLLCARPSEITFVSVSTKNLTAAPTEQKNQHVIIKSIYGAFEIDDPAFIAILQSPIMERIKKVTQGGITDVVFKELAFSRFDHCVGVALLLKKFGASREEQLAGLLHDASHTAFSHMGDMVYYQGAQRHSYQDNIHDWYLEKCDINKLLKPFGYTLYDVSPKRSAFTLLERDLPDICVDRLEYNIRSGVTWKLIKEEDALTIVNNLHYEDSHWFFTDATAARKLGDLSLELTKLFCTPWNKLMYMWGAESIKQAFKIGLVTPEEFHFSNDYDVWEKLQKSDDPTIQENVQKIINVHDHYESAPEGTKPDFIAKTKFRGINPFVKTEHGLQLLTEIDKEFKVLFEQIRKTVTDGVPYRLTKKKELGSGNNNQLTQAIY